jgi:hypothetical protein
LVDITRHCLDRAGRRLARFKPELHEVNLLAPLKLDLIAVRLRQPHLCAALLARPHEREACGGRSFAAADGQTRRAVRRDHPRPRDRAERGGAGAAQSL